MVDVTVPISGMDKVGPIRVRRRPRPRSRFPFPFPLVRLLLLLPIATGGANHLRGVFLDRRRRRLWRVIVVVDLHGGGGGGWRRGRRRNGSTFVIGRGEGRSPPGLTLTVAVADKGGKARQDLSLPARRAEPTRVEAGTTTRKLESVILGHEPDTKREQGRGVLPDGVLGAASSAHVGFVEVTSAPPPPAVEQVLVQVAREGVRPRAVALARLGDGPRSRDGGTVAARRGAVGQRLQDRDAGRRVVGWVRRLLRAGRRGRRGASTRHLVVEGGGPLRKSKTKLCVAPGPSL